METRRLCGIGSVLCRSPDCLLACPKGALVPRRSRPANRDSRQFEVSAEHPVTYRPRRTRRFKRLSSVDGMDEIQDGAPGRDVYTFKHMSEGWATMRPLLLHSVGG
jgi:hypothetical protein